MLLVKLWIDYHPYKNINSKAQRLCCTLFTTLFQHLANCVVDSRYIVILLNERKNMLGIWKSLQPSSWLCRWVNRHPAEMKSFPGGMGPGLGFGWWASDGSPAPSCLLLLQLSRTGQVFKNYRFFQIEWLAFWISHSEVIIEKYLLLVCSI